VEFNFAKAFTKMKFNLEENYCAVVVTFNRSDKLRHTIAHIRRQTHKPVKIYIIDNNSTDNTYDVCDAARREDESIIYEKLPVNIGGAGGFSRGLEIAYRAGHQKVWIMDDDCFPEVECAQELLTAFASCEKTGFNPPFVCSRVLWTDGNTCEMNNPVPHWNWAARFSSELPLVLVNSCSFVSVMFDRNAIKEYGLPITEYFIWHDDVEYTMRCTRDFPGVCNLKSIAIHALPSNRGVNYSDLNASNSWKFIHGARNVHSDMVQKSGWGSTLKSINKIRVVMRRANVDRKIRMQVLKSALHGAIFFRPPIKRVN
jgi:glycosyltransferase involved in cell wall biosynthesis